MECVVRVADPSNHGQVHNHISGQICRKEDINMVIAIIIIVCLLFAVPFLMVGKDIREARESGALYQIVCAIAEIALVVIYIWFICWRTWG